MSAHASFRLQGAGAATLTISSEATPCRLDAQTGALPGGQPGQGVNTSTSPAGQSNMDAAVQQGVEYGKKDDQQR